MKHVQNLIKIVKANLCKKVFYNIKYREKNNFNRYNYCINSRNAWWCFPFEALESLSVHLMWVAAATYCALLAPKNLLATLIGVLGMVHFSIGNITLDIFNHVLYLPVYCFRKRKW